MNKIARHISILLCYAIFISCSQNNRKSIDNESGSIDSIAIIYGINGEDIAIRNGPGKDYNKVVNEKATQIVGNIQYCQVDFSTKVVILEKKDSWCKIKVVEPAWLSDTYIGWIPSDVLITKEDEEKQTIWKLNPEDYEILQIDDNNAVENIHVLLKTKKFDKNYVYQFIKEFRKENCSRNCNIGVYDSKSIQSLVSIYPLSDSQYLKLADHLISLSTFDATEVRDWYPYQDFHYYDLGGKNWKKTPIRK